MEQKEKEKDHELPDGDKLVTVRGVLLRRRLEIGPRGGRHYLWIREEQFRVSSLGGIWSWSARQAIEG